MTSGKVEVAVAGAGAAGEVSGEDARRRRTNAQHGWRSNLRKLQMRRKTSRIRI
jgi:hypothetical protein